MVGSVGRMGWWSWLVGPWRVGGLPQTGGVRPQLTVLVDLDSLLGRSSVVGGEVGGAGPLDPQADRRLACDVC